MSAKLWAEMTGRRKRKPNVRAALLLASMLALTGMTLDDIERFDL